MTNLAVMNGGRNQLEQVFNYGATRVRTVAIDGEPWFVAKDVCDVLEIINSKMATTRLPEKMKSGVSITDPHGRYQITTVISEPGLYKLVFQSRKPQAEAFANWVAEEVLPAIRKTGTYSVGIPKTYEEALEAHLAGLKRERLMIEEKEKMAHEIKVLAPKAENYEHFLNSEESLDMGEVAKVLNIPKNGRNRLFEILRSWGHLSGGGRGGLARNVPYQKFVDAEYYEVHWIYIDKRNPITGIWEQKPYPKCQVLPKGLEYIKNRLFKDGLVTRKNVSKCG